MGDLRNKWRKYEREAIHERQRQEQLARDRARGDQTPRCRCGNSALETLVYQCEQDGLFCMACMPLKWKMQLIEVWARTGMRYSAAEHGED